MICRMPFATLVFLFFIPFAVVAIEGVKESASSGINANPIKENFILSIPDLEMTGPSAVSWYFFRSGSLWNGKSLLHLDQIRWPVWDTKQIPVALVPIQKYKTDILIYDANKNLIETINLKKYFSPEEFFAAASIKPVFYQISIEVFGDQTSDSPVKLTSQFYTWYQRRKIANCKVDASSENFNLLKNKSFAICLDTLKAYLSETNTDSRQVYIQIDWPIIKGRENITGVQSTERDLRTNARKKNAIYISKNTRSFNLTAEVGLTQVEHLPEVMFPVSKLADFEVAAAAPDSKIAQRPFYSVQIEDGSKIELTSYYSDLTQNRSLVSPILGVGTEVSYRQIQLQLVNQKQLEGKAQYSQHLVPNTVSLIRTQGLDQRTGLLGQLRYWQFLSSVGVNFLSSGLGENVTVFGFPGIDVRYFNLEHILQPYFSFEKNLIFKISSLEITELKAGVSKQVDWFSGAYINLGYQQYSLSGINTGAARLGDLKAFVIGGGAMQRFEDWSMREKIDFLFGNSTSYDTRFELGKYIKIASEEKLIVGGYLGYSNYQAYITNKLEIKEILSERRTQMGLFFGWVGIDIF